MGLISKSERELLKAVYRLSQGTSQAGAHTGALADKLGATVANQVFDPRVKPAPLSSPYQ